MSGVLSGVRVVELASWTYVPAAGVALADWGADIVKVESVVGGDPGRALVVGGFTRQAARADTDFILELSNRGKRSIAIDLKVIPAGNSSAGCSPRPTYCSPTGCRQRWSGPA
jgi:crotonobetainyl-CoA:carnitine CoA-transferase CaiB-like acyl-CoA transferase